MIVGGGTTFGLGLDFGIMILALALMVGIATRLYPTIIT